HRPSRRRALADRARRLRSAQPRPAGAARRRSVPDAGARAQARIGRTPSSPDRGARTVNRQRVVQIERHPLGLRLHLVGIRVHEWHLGAAVLGALAVGAALHRVHLTLAAGLAATAGGWLLAQDWPD